MASLTHEKYVQALQEFSESKLSRYKNYYCFVDHSFSESIDKPPKINGFVPDLYGATIGEEITLIGEAETYEGIRSHHTEQQLLAFLNFLKNRSNPHLIIATRWDMVPMARTIVRRLKASYDAHRVKEDYVLQLL